VNALVKDISTPLLQNSTLALWPAGFPHAPGLGQTLGEDENERRSFVLEVWGP
jgi:hypothetical protein